MVRLWNLASSRLRFSFSLSYSPSWLFSCSIWCLQAAFRPILASRLACLTSFMTLEWNFSLTKPRPFFGVMVRSLLLVCIWDVRHSACLWVGSLRELCPCGVTLFGVVLFSYECGWVATISLLSLRPVYRTLRNGDAAASLNDFFDLSRSRASFRAVNSPAGDLAVLYAIVLRFLVSPAR